MSFEDSAGLSVRNSYGHRTTNNRFGGALPGNGAIRQLEYVFSYDDLPAASTSEMEHLIPDNSTILEVYIYALEAFTGGTSYDIDLVDTAGGAIGSGEDKLYDALTTAEMTTIGETNLSSLHSGTNSGDALNIQITEPSQLQVVATGTFTAGKARVVIDYIPYKAV